MCTLKITCKYINVNIKPLLSVNKYAQCVVYAQNMNYNISIKSTRKDVNSMDRRINTARANMNRQMMKAGARHERRLGTGTRSNSNASAGKRGH